MTPLGPSLCVFTFAAELVLIPQPRERDLHRAGGLWQGQKLTWP